MNSLSVCTMLYMSLLLSVGRLRPGMCVQTDSTNNDLYTTSSAAVLGSCHLSKTELVELCKCVLSPYLLKSEQKSALKYLLAGITSIQIPPASVHLIKLEI